MPNESEFTRRRAEAFQNLIDDFCSNEINYVDFMDGIKEHRGTNAEGRACIEQIRARGHEDRIPGTFEDDLPPIIVRSFVLRAELAESQTSWLAVELSNSIRRLTQQSHVKS